MFKSYLWCTGGKAIVGEKLNRKKVASFVEKCPWSVYQWFTSLGSYHTLNAWLWKIDLLENL